MNQFKVTWVADRQENVLGRFERAVFAIQWNPLLHEPEPNFFKAGDLIKLTEDHQIFSRPIHHFAAVFVNNHVIFDSDPSPASEIHTHTHTLTTLFVRRKRLA